MAIGDALLGGGARGPVTLVSDTFTRADSALTLGNAETGQAWSVGDAGDAATLPTFGISTNQAYAVSLGNQSDPHVIVDSGVADCTIQCGVIVPTSLGSGVLFRRANSSNYFAVYLNTATVTILRNLAGVRSSVASASRAVSVGATVAVKVVLVGSSIKVYCDGLLLITYTDANNATATKHGFFAQTGGGGAVYDNFLVTVP